MDITGNTLYNEGRELHRNSNISTTTVTYHWVSNLDSVSVEPSTSSTLIGTVPAIISAGGALTGSHRDKIDNVSIRENSAPTKNSISSPDLTDNNLPNNILFQINPDSTSGYLIETDPNFADYREWLSSDYMLNALAIDPTLSQKRMGDGFYEQQLIRQQISQITGKRYLPGFSDDEGQYKALMNAGVTFALEYELIPGVALNAEQMANLTSDMVWLVEEEVTLPDGSTQKVLVPRLYATTKPQALNSGALIAADVVNLTTEGDLGNSGDIIGRRVVSINVDNMNSVGGRIRAGDELRAIAQHDLNLASSLAETHIEQNGTRADSSVRASADIKQMNRIAGLYVENPDAILLASAGRDINLQGAAVENSGDGGQTTLTAGRDLNLGTITETQNSRATFKKGWFSDELIQEVGSNIRTTADVELLAERDINIRAGSVSSEQGTIAATAGQDLTIEAGEAERHTQLYRESHSSGFLSSKSTTVHNTADTTRAIASTFSGDQVQLQAGNDIKVAGSSVVGTGDVDINAGRDIDITSVETTRNETHFRDEKRSGIFSGGGIGFTIGSQQKSDDIDQQTVRQVSSTIGSLEGDINVDADRDVTITASDLLAQSGSINVSGDNVTIDSANDTFDLKEEHTFKQSGLTIAVTGGVVDAIQTIANSAERTQTAKDKRLQALNAWRVGRVAQDIPNGIGSLENLGNDFSNPTQPSNPAATSGVNLSFRIGSSSSEQTVTQHDETALGSSLLAHNEINITARGNTDEGPIEEGGVNPPAAPTGGDINMEGALLEAANINLNANNELNLKSAENTHDRQEDSESNSAGIGFSIGSDGLLFFVDASVSRGEVNQSSDKYLETLINGSNKVSMLSGGDTTLEGAQVTAPRIEVESGGDLNIISQQDQEHYSNDQQSAGFKVAAGYGKWSVSVNASQLEADSDYVAVQEQSGLFAGDGGYDVQVAKNTHLEGGAIVSSADPENNRLNTDTLSHNSIHNYAEYDIESKSISFSTSGTYGASGATVDSSGPTKGLGGGFSSDSGEAENTTYAAISPGEVTIRSNPEQDLSGIKRSKEEAHQVLERIFSEDKIQQAQETVELTQIFAEEGYIAVGKMYQGLENAVANLARAKERGNAQEIARCEKQLAAEQAKMPVDKAVAHAIIGGITSILGGGNFMQGALAAGVNEAVATEIKDKLGKDATLQNLAAVLIGGALGGGQGALIAGIADQYNRQLHPTEIEFLEDEERRQRYIDRVREEEGRIITLEEAEVELKAAASADNDDHWKEEIEVPIREIAITFIHKERQGLTYIDSSGKVHDLLVSTDAERADESINLEYWQDTKDRLTEIFPEDTVWQRIEALALPVAAVHGTGKELKESVEGMYVLGKTALDENTREKVKAFVKYADEHPEEAKQLLDDALSKIPGELKVSVLQEINRFSLYEAQQRNYDLEVAGSQKVAGVVNPLKKLNLGGGILLGIIKKIPDEKIGHKGKKAGASNSFSDKNFQAKEFESSIKSLPPGERVAQIKVKTKEVADTRGWKPVKGLKKKTGRDVYEGGDGHYYSVDTEKGRFEKINPKTGKHLGEYDLDLNQTAPPDPTGRHDLRLK